MNDCETNIEPSKPAPGRPPYATISTTAPLEPVQRKYPVLGFGTSEVVFLAMQIGCDIRAEKGEETGDGERLVTISNNRVVYGMLIEVIRQERDCRVDGNHEENTYYAVNH